MPGIFDLSKIKTLIDEERPSAIIIIDTNVILREPDFANWKTSFERPVFVLPCLMNLELAHLKNKPDSTENAHAATRKIAELCREGRISGGIFKEGIGWFVSTPLPERESLETELEKLNSLVKVFGQADTELVILAKELVQTVTDVPIIFATADANLFNAVQFVGINAFLFTGFPMTGIEIKSLTPQLKTVNWDSVLEDIQLDAARRLVQVDLTLLSKSCAPKWINRLDEAAQKTQVIVAEGTGVIHAVSDIRFSWVLPFLPWDFPALKVVSEDEIASSPHPENLSPDSNKLGLGITDLDFAGLENAIAPNLHKALVKKINNCASPMAYIEDMPTVQDPIAVMKQFFLFEYIFQEKEFLGKLPQDSLNEFEKKLKNYNNLLNWAFYWLYDREASKEDRNISFGEFLHAMRSCWSIGDTIRIDLLTDQAELTNLKGEAEDL